MANRTPCSAMEIKVAIAIRQTGRTDFIVTTSVIVGGQLAQTLRAFDLSSHNGTTGAPPLACGRPFQGFDFSSQNRISRAPSLRSLQGRE